MNDVDGGLVKALGEVWATPGGKFMLLGIGAYLLLNKHLPRLLAFWRGRIEINDQANTTNTRLYAEHFEQLRKEARDAASALVTEMRERIDALEDMVTGRDHQIKILLDHQAQCGADLRTAQAEIKALRERISGYGAAIENLRSQAVEREQNESRG